MKMTKANIQENGRASFAVWKEDPREGYKLTGSARYLTGGPNYDFANGEMRKETPDRELQGCWSYSRRESLRHHIGSNSRPVNMEQELRGWGGCFEDRDGIDSHQGYICSKLLFFDNLDHPTSVFQEQGPVPKPMDESWGVERSYILPPLYQFIIFLRER